MTIKLSKINYLLPLIVLVEMSDLFVGLEVFNPVLPCLNTNKRFAELADECLVIQLGRYCLISEIIVQLSVFFRFVQV